MDLNGSGSRRDTMTALVAKRMRFRPSNSAAQLKLMRFHSSASYPEHQQPGASQSLKPLVLAGLAVCILFHMAAFLPHFQLANPLPDLLSTLRKLNTNVLAPMLFVVLCIYFLSGLIKGIAGIGMGLIAVPITAIFYGPVTAIAMIAVPLVITNFWQGVVTRERKQTVRCYWPLATSLGISMAICSYYATRFPTSLFSILLGFMAIIFVVLSLRPQNANLNITFRTKGQLGFGTLTGVIGGLTGLVVIPLVFFMMCSRVKKEEFVSALGLLLFISGVSLLVGYGLNSFMTKEMLLLSCLATLPAFLGVLIGERLRRHINEKNFKKLVLLLVCMIGVKILVTEIPRAIDQAIALQF